MPSCVCAAMFLERIVGRDITKPISALGFHDVHYLRQMLYCVFKSLHQAQRKLAFHHADLRLANIMELMPDDHKGGSLASSTATVAPSRSGRLQDASHHDSQHHLGVHPDDLAAVNLRETATQQPAASPSGDQHSYGLQNASVQTQTQDPVMGHDSPSMATVEAEGIGDLQDGNFKVTSTHSLLAFLHMQPCYRPACVYDFVTKHLAKLLHCSKSRAADCYMLSPKMQKSGVDVKKQKSNVCAPCARYISSVHTAVVTFKFGMPCISLICRLSLPL